MPYYLPFNQGFIPLCYINTRELSQTFVFTFINLIYISVQYGGGFKNLYSQGVIYYIKYNVMLFVVSNFIFNFANNKIDGYRLPFMCPLQKNKHMKDRIRMIMESQQMSQKEFAQFTGISEGSLSGIFNERTRPTIQMIESIHEKLPNISVEWIMFGTGSMYMNHKVQSSPESLGNAQYGQPFQGHQPSSLAGSLFDETKNAPMVGQDIQPSGVAKTIVKYVDKPERKITEIRIFYDDQTWETFLPKR